MDLSLIPSSSSALWDVDLPKRCCWVRVDRLSSLPDELLIMVLSLLPTKDALAVCVLSSRLWRVFPCITSLNFDDSSISHCVQQRYGVERFPTYLSFVDSILNRFEFDYLTRFRLVVGPDFETRYFKSCDAGRGGCRNKCLPHLKATQINAWISFALTLHGLRELDICIQVKIPHQRQLPPAIFTCETLEVLKLNFNLCLQKASTIPFRLPNLKILKFHASVMCKSDEGFMTRLVSSCPRLEDVTWESHWKDVHSIRLSSVSLRRLCLRMHNGYAAVETKFVHIDTPNLEYIEYSDEVAMQYSVSVSKCLIEASITIGTYGSYKGKFQTYGEMMLSLIRPLCNVQHLYLRIPFLEDMNFVKVDDRLPIFRNLKRLELGCYRVSNWYEVLLAFFNCSPVLETLVFPEGLIADVHGIKDSYLRESHLFKEKFPRVAQTSLPCFNLKRIEIKNCYGKEQEVDLIRFMLKHALVLEKLVICRCQKAEHSISIADQLALDSISYFPRASVTCSILLQ